MAPKRHLQPGPDLAQPCAFHAPPGGDVWIASRIEGGWDLWLRFVPEDGHPVVAELHVLPSPPDGSTASAASPSMRHLILSRDALPWAPPAGGLALRTLRKRVTFGASLAAAYGAVKGWSAAEPSAAASLSERGFVADGHRRKPGRKSAPDYTYGPDIVAYVEAVRRSSPRAVEDVARALGVEARNVRDRLYVARERGLLTRPPKGRAAGELTAKGREAVAEARRRGLLPGTKPRRSRAGGKEQH